MDFVSRNWPCMRMRHVAATHKERLNAVLRMMGDGVGRSQNCVMGRTIGVLPVFLEGEVTSERSRRALLNHDVSQTPGCASSTDFNEGRR